MNKRLSGKVALVTGCGSSGPGWGNGKAIAALFAREGASIFGCDINQEAAAETCEIVREESGEMSVQRCDVADAAQVEQLVASCMERYGRIDVLVNNVGIVDVGGPVEYPLEKWKRALDVNVTSMFLTCKYVIPHMFQQGGGNIVNIGSIAGIRYSGVPYISYYTTKSATLGFSRGVALQYAKDNIRSNVIMPGLMQTPFVVEPLKGIYGGGDIDAMMEKRNSQCPTGHMGDAWNVAQGALYLASDESSYVTGTELIIDGGITAKFA
jgi:NAD(P)-dependent dehydrogenase (short-subunit alcohol dehydrogenase family)